MKFFLRIFDFALIRPLNKGYKKNIHDKKGAEAKNKTPVLNNL